MSNVSNLDVFSLYALNTMFEQNPYPTKEEKEKLLEQTRLDIKQINSWFSNARRKKMNQNCKRHKKNDSSCESSYESYNSMNSCDSTESDQSYQSYQSKNPLPIVEIIRLFFEESLQVLSQCDLSLLPFCVKDLLYLTSTWHQYAFLMHYIDEHLVDSSLLESATKKVVYNEPEWQCVDLLHYALVKKLFLYAQSLLDAGVPALSLHLPNGMILTVEDLKKI